MDKDFKMLRPLDVAAALRGEPVCYAAHPDTCIQRYLDGPDKNGRIAYLSEDGILYTGPASAFRMTPMFWLEGRPVYKGDEPYYMGNKRRVTGMVSGFVEIDGSGGVLVPLEELTWTPPMVMRKGFINICKVKVKAGSCGEIKDRIVRNADIFDDENEALKWASQCGDVLATVAVEWPEPAVQEVQESDWIDWNGGECPVSDDVRVQVCFRSAPESTIPSRPSRWRWDWGDKPSSGDIIAYRVVKEGGAA